MMRSVFTTVLRISLILGISLKFGQAQDDAGVYNIGAGIADITGPSVDLFLMGYVNPIGFSAGIHTRLYARAFVVQSVTSENRVAFVSCDMGMLDHGLKLAVIESLTEIYGDLYTSKNVLISTTHTHSGPSGFIQYFGYVAESGSFSPINFKAIVDGIVDSIVEATETMRRGKIYSNTGELLGTNGNRSPEAYDMNPIEERDQYKHNVDKNMTILRFEEAETREPIGLISWFAVHPISFNGGMNPLVSSDNKGYASLHFEQKMDPGSLPGKGKFVGAFASTNLGDSSPRTNPMDEEKKDKEIKEWDLTDRLNDTSIVGTRQSDKAWELFHDLANLKPISGPIQFGHQFVEMHTVKVNVQNPETGEEEEKQLCKSAMGYEFVGLDPNEQEFWDSIRDQIKKPSEEMIECQKPKPIALPAGEMTIPFQWAPSIADIQVLRLGTFEIIGVPGEFTTMSGRRMRKAIETVTGGHEVVIAGVCNVYLHYVATPEEYDIQEYEGSSTLFGRHTLDGYLKLYSEMVDAIMKGTEGSIPDGPTPPAIYKKLVSTNPPTSDIEPASGEPFGAVVQQPKTSYKAGDKLTVRFVAGSPRHNPHRGGTFFTVEKMNEDNKWVVVKTDGDLDTRFWFHKNFKQMEIHWDIPGDTVTGTYRIRHFGHFLEQKGKVPKSYFGATNTFRVEA